MNKYQEALEFLCDNSKLTQFNINQSQWASETIQELVGKHEKIKKTLNKVISERINETGKVLEREEISYIQALQFVLKLLDWSEDESK